MSVRQSGSGRTSSEVDDDPLAKRTALRSPSFDHAPWSRSRIAVNAPVNGAGRHRSLRNSNSLPWQDVDVSTGACSG